MGKDRYEKIEDYLIKKGKKHKIIIPLIMIALTIVFCVSRIMDFFKKRYIRIALIILAIGLFFIGISIGNEKIDDIVPEMNMARDSGELIVMNNETKIEEQDNNLLLSESVNETTKNNTLTDDKTKQDADDGFVAAEEDNSILFEKSDWKLILVNKQHPIPDDYLFELTTIKGQMQCDVRVLDELNKMIEDAKNEGYKLKICSPYRDEEKQNKLFSKKINKYMKEGYSYMESYKLAAQTVTVPGTSEHEIGLAFDIVSTSYTALNEGFGDTNEGQWLKNHCFEYGFVIRYPEGKEYITGIEYEPWHLRYVGVDAAEVIMNNNLCLEEFWDMYL